MSICPSVLAKVIDIRVVSKLIEPDGGRLITRSGRWELELVLLLGHASPLVVGITRGYGTGPTCSEALDDARTQHPT